MPHTVASGGTRVFLCRQHLTQRRGQAQRRGLVVLRSVSGPSLHSDGLTAGVSHCTGDTTRASAVRQTRSIDLSEAVSVERRSLTLAGVGFLVTTSGSALAEECTLVKAANGLQYCDTKLGTGKEPAKGQLIRCHYTGRLASNNAVFDSSYERRRPLSFKIGASEVIKGWDAGILGGSDVPPMKEGSKRRLIIPPELGYGARGAGGIIPPNATLVFDVELLGKR